VVYAVVRALAQQCRHTRGVVRAANVSPDAPLEILGLNQKLRAAGGFAIALSAHACLTHSELHSTTHAAGGTGISDSWASVLPLRSAAEQVPQGLLEVRAAESVICLQQPRRQHPLIGAREFPCTLFA
jgi:hypothetical protein